MTAQAIKKKGKSPDWPDDGSAPSKRILKGPRQKTRPDPTPLQQKILNTFIAQPDLSSNKIAEICDTSHVTVRRVLDRYGVPGHRPTILQQKIIQVSQDHPDLSSPEVAAICDTSHVTVRHVLKRYSVDRESIENYKSNRADLFAGFQSRVLLSITDEDLSNAPLSARGAFLGVLYDKERLERGLSTLNNSTNVNISVQMDSRTQALMAQAISEVSSVIDVVAPQLALPEPDPSTLPSE